MHRGKERVLLVVSEYCWGTPFHLLNQLDWLPLAGNWGLKLKTPSALFAFLASRTFSLETLRLFLFVFSTFNQLFRQNIHNLFYIWIVSITVRIAIDGVPNLDHHRMINGVVHPNRDVAWNIHARCKYVVSKCIFHWLGELDTQRSISLAFCESSLQIGLKKHVLVPGRSWCFARIVQMSQNCQICFFTGCQSIFLSTLSAY